MSANLTANLIVGTLVELDKVLTFNANKPYEVTYNQDTILVTATRMANSTVNVGGVQAGWNHIQKKTNNDGAVRYISECLVALTGTTSNTFSSNTSWGAPFTGL